MTQVAPIAFRLIDPSPGIPDSFIPHETYGTWAGVILGWCEGGIVRARDVYPPSAVEGETAIYEITRDQKTALSHMAFTQGIMGNRISYHDVIAPYDRYGYREVAGEEGRYEIVEEADKEETAKGQWEKWNAQGLIDVPSGEDMVVDTYPNGVLVRDQSLLSKGSEEMAFKPPPTEEEKREAAVSFMNKAREKRLTKEAKEEEDSEDGVAYISDKLSDIAVNLRKPEKQDANTQTPANISEEESASVMDDWLAEGTGASEEVVEKAGPLKGDALKKQREKVAQLKSTLNEGQRAALEGILSAKKGMCLVEGHAGTGKSYVLKVAMESVREEGRNICCLAPTHQALDQITDLYEDKNVFSTVAGFMNVKNKINKDSGEDEFTDPKMADMPAGSLLFVDECSMLKPKEVRILEQIAREVRVVVFGDFAQLPPVKEEAVDFHEEVDDDSQYRLTEQMRNGDMVLFLCNHFRKKTAIPATSKGNVTVYDRRREMLGVFIDHIKKDPIPGDNVYLAYTNKMMRKVREDIQRLIYDNEIYPVGSWVRLEFSDELHKTQGGGISSKRRIIIGKILDTKTSEVRLMGKTFTSYLLKLEDKEGNIVTHCPPISGIGKKLIPQDSEWFMTLSFEDLDELDELTKKGFNENRLRSKRISRGEKNLKPEQEKGIHRVQESQKLAKALSPYSLTVHKSQGMSIQNVFLDADNIVTYQNMPDHPTRELLYVGASRTRKQLHLFNAAG